MSDLTDRPIHLLAPRLTRTSNTACGLPGNDNIRLHVITRVDGQGITCEGCRAWFSKKGLQALIKGYLEDAAGLGRDALLPNSHGDIWVDKASAALAQTIQTAIENERRQREVSDE